MPITTDKTVHFFPVPIRGIIRSVPAHAIPIDGLYDARNVIVRNGVLRARPTYESQNVTALSGSAVGCGEYLTAAGVFKLIVITTTSIYSVGSSGGSLTDLTSGALTGTLYTNIGRMTTIVLGSGGSSANHVIMTNGKDAPQKWNGAAATVSTVAGSPPLWTDICTIDDKIVGIIPPYQVQWGATRSIGVWPALNFKQMGETPDRIVAIRPGPGTTLGTIYKANSIWSIVPTGNAADASAFRFPFATIAEGPANPSAVVDANGRQFRMTRSGRIGMWDGTKNTWVASNIAPMLRDQFMGGIEPNSIFGWYNPAQDEVNFCWHSGASSLQFMLTITPPVAADSDYVGWVSCLNGVPPTSPGIIETVRANVGVMTTGVYGHADQGENVAFIINDKGRINKYDELTLAANMVDRINISGSKTSCPVYGWWETSLQPMPNLESVRIESVETFAARGQGFGNLDMQPVYSYVLGNSEAETQALDGNDVRRYGKAVLVSLQGLGAANSDIEPVRDDVGLDAKGRFVGLRYGFAAGNPGGAAGDITTLSIRYYGSLLKAQKPKP